jgi:hypothetical protein
LSILAENDFVAHQLDVTAAFLYSELKESIDISQPNGYRDTNTVAYLKRFIYRLNHSCRE